MKSKEIDTTESLLAEINELEASRIKGILWKQAAQLLSSKLGHESTEIFNQIANEVLANEKELEKNGIYRGIIQDVVTEFRREYQSTGGAL